jgi:class 3 adenylate cyclase/tetratricopeptide (TPR) repeat protein
MDTQDVSASAARAARLPTGTVTFLFTDIEGSTRLLKHLGSSYGDVLAAHRTILREAVRRQRGEEVDTQGDSFLFAFSRADEAARAAIDGQRALADHEWPSGAELRVRMALHTAEPSSSDEGYFGLGVHRAARIMAAAHGGQILASLAAFSVLADAELDGARLHELGEYWLKDLDRPERLYQLDAAGLKDAFPPPGQARPAPATEPADEVADNLLERSEAIAQLEDSFARVARARRGQLVIVCGEAGIGKTRLLRRFCEIARPSSRVLWGSCDPLFTPRPLGPIFDIAENVGGELEEVVNDGGKPHTVAAALMRQLDAPEQTVLVLEDLHWADEATLDVVSLLGRRIETVPALTVLTYRDDELDRRHPLRMLLGAVATADSVHRLDLAPLSRQAVAEFADAHDVDAEELFRKTGGNPFFVTEAVAAGEGDLPQTVREAVLARAARLTPEGEALLGAVAIAPPSVEPWLLEALAGGELSAIDECLASGMLVQTPEGLAFRHELARLAIEKALSPNRRVDLHRKALEALADPPAAGPDVERLAHHAEAAGDAASVLRYAPAAALRAAELGAHREAAAQYERALRFASGLATDARAELLKLRSHECYLTDQPDEALAALEEVVACFRELGDRRGEGDALRRLANIRWCPGRTAEAAEAARESISVLEQLPPGSELAKAYATSASLLKDKSEPEQAIAQARRALELAERAEDIETQAHALNSIGMSQLLAGDIAGLPTLERSVALAEAHELADQLGRGWVHLVQIGAFQHRYELVDPYLEPALAYLRERGMEIWQSYLRAFGAKAALDRGEWDQAAELAALVFQKQVISTFPRIVAFVVLGLLRVRRGEPDAHEPLDEALALAEPTGELLRIAPVAAARAEAAWLAGDRDHIEMATRLAYELALEQRIDWVGSELAYWRSRAGLDIRVPADPSDPYALQIGGDWRAAAERWTAIGCPYNAALALGEADDERAVQRGIDELTRLGAKAVTERVASRR